ncbi:peptide/nickel transport system ATP-binding protein [Streptosporangium subroseum]|uniref:Peptide/nickel transport system ATP-binding protein n=1 Tax=Streptosporangium subroseum TaxID=106412 RepID=A0A239NWG3_9ACTN|nr:ABC transporter ATP-binding protein [Streptosporangium subroseum]SNT58704.1 peptide/nickel transport system ATP-binding protein [Streptosporangium subroseum]
MTAARAEPDTGPGGEPHTGPGGGPGAEPAGHLVTVEGLSVDLPTRQGVVHAVRDVSLSLRAGECLAVVGESGSGKSVTARALLGLAGDGADVRARTLTFAGRDLRRLTPRQWRLLRGRHIGYVLQDALTSLDPLRRVGDEVAEPLEVHGLASRDDLDELVAGLLAEVGVPDPGERLMQYPHELSGGLRQRALIASAIAARPSLLIADEPTTALDVTVQAQVLALLEARREAGTAVLLISHDLAVVARLADHIAILYAGTVVERGPAADLLAAPAHPYTAELLAAVPTVDGPRREVPAPRSAPPAETGCPYAPRCPLADDRCAAQAPPPVAHGPGREVRCWHPGTVRPGPPDPDVPPLPLDRPAAPAGGAHAVRPASPNGRAAAPAAGPAPGRAVVTVRGITKRFRSPGGSWRTAVDDVSFDLVAGEALGIVGESGSGKSTIARIVLTEFDADAGSVLLDGQAWSGLRERDRRARRSRIQLVDQDPLSSFDPRFTVEDVVAEALPRARHGGRDRVVALLGQVGLQPGLLRRRPGQLSGGQRQRVAIARALAPAPDVIVCDEPVSALDVTVQAQILALLTRLRRDAGVSLLFISHDLGVIRQVCDRVAVMKDGAIVEIGDVDTVFRSPRAVYTTALLAAVPRIDAGPHARKPVSATDLKGPP